MSELKNIPTEELVQELLSRDGVERRSKEGYVTRTRHTTGR